MSQSVNRPTPEPNAKMTLAVVGGGRRCYSLLKMLESRRLEGLRAEIVGVADINPEAVGYRYAKESGIFTTLDYRSLLGIPGLEVIVNLTGSQTLCLDIQEQAPANVAVLPYPASRLFQEIVKEVLNATRHIEDQADELSRFQSFARAMNQATIVGVMILDVNHRIVWINEAALKGAGLSREEAMGRYCFQVSHQQTQPCTDRDARCPMKETLITGMSAHAIHEHRSASGKATYHDVSTFPLYNRDGQVIEVVEVIRDITEELNDKLERRTRSLKDDMARLVQEDKLIALGKMVASVAHEINNPIGSIINFSKLIQEYLSEGDPTPEQLVKFNKYLELTVREAQRCGNIVSSLLSFSRQQTVEPKVLNICDLIERIITLTRHKMELSNIELERYSERDCLETFGDHTQIQQCIVNLVFNAMEAMPDGGTLTLRSSFDAKKNVVRLEVSDTGIGIAPEHMPFIFEPFFTTKKEGHGVGLGLSMVYGIVREHGGEISVDSREGHGATFTISLPALLNEHAPGGT